MIYWSSIGQLLNISETSVLRHSNETASLTVVVRNVHLYDECTHSFNTDHMTSYITTVTTRTIYNLFISLKSVYPSVLRFIKVCAKQNSRFRTKTVSGFSVFSIHTCNIKCSTQFIEWWTVFTYFFIQQHVKPVRSPIDIYFNIDINLWIRISLCITFAYGYI